MTQSLTEPSDLTVIVPTRNEAGNIAPLLARLSTSLRTPATVLFVDDSDDDTPEVVRREAMRGYSGLDVQLLHRRSVERRGGLGGAVLAGLDRADTTWVCVMDGDLQHPPECVRTLLDAAVTQEADLVVGSRYVQGGRNEGLGFVRTIVSVGSTILAKLVFPYRLRDIHDPMSGFFLFRRDSMTEPMTPRGFKILMEMAVRHPDLVRCEVPFVFVERTEGTSKGTLKEGFRYLRLLADMRWSLSREQASRSTRQLSPARTRALARR
jgi:dolichol-phosphate mannosyltransferase